MRKFLLWAMPPVLLGLIGFGCMVGAAIESLGNWDVVESNNVEGVAILTPDQPTLRLPIELVLGDKELSSEESLDVQTTVTPLSPTSLPVQVTTTTTDHEGPDIVELTLSEPAASTGVEVRWTVGGWVEGSEVDPGQQLLLAVDKPVDHAATIAPLAVWSHAWERDSNVRDGVVDTGVEAVGFDITVSTGDTALSVSRPRFSFDDQALIRVATDGELLELVPGARLPLAVPASCSTFPCTFRAAAATTTRHHQFEIAIHDDLDMDATAELVNLGFTHNRRRFDLAPIDVQASTLVSFDIGVGVDQPRAAIASATDFVHVQFGVAGLTESVSLDPAISSSFVFVDRDRDIYEVAVPVDRCCDFSASGRVDLLGAESAQARITVIVDYLSLERVDLDDRNLVVTIGEPVVELR